MNFVLKSLYFKFCKERFFLVPIIPLYANCLYKCLYNSLHLLLNTKKLFFNSCKFIYSTPFYFYFSLHKKTSTIILGTGSFFIVRFFPFRFWFSITINKPHFFPMFINFFNNLVFCFRFHFYPAFESIILILSRT